MPDPDKANVVSGFVAVEAVRRAGLQPARPRIRTGPAPQKPEPRPLPRGPQPLVIGSDGKPPSPRIGHTALPPRHEIVCYECSYMFVMQGRVWTTQCPKCRQRLENVDHVIEDEHTESIRTIGKVTVTETGKLKGCDVRARELLLAGAVKDARVETGHLQLAPTARFDIKDIRAKNIVVEAGGEFAFEHKLSCRDVTVAGTLHAVLFSEGLILVQAGGFLKGELHGSHLVVEPGGALKADISIISEHSKA